MSGGHGLLLRVITSQDVYMLMFSSHPTGICWRFSLWQNTGEMTTTMSLLCISSYTEDGCSSRSRARTTESNQMLLFFFVCLFCFAFLQMGRMNAWILILLLIRDIAHCVTFWAFDSELGENPSALLTLSGNSASCTSALQIEKKNCWTKLDFF